MLRTGTLLNRSHDYELGPREKFEAIFRYSSVLATKFLECHFAHRIVRHIIKCIKYMVLGECTVCAPRYHLKPR